MSGDSLEQEEIEISESVGRILARVPEWSLSNLSAVPHSTLLLPPGPRLAREPLLTLLCAPVGPQLSISTVINNKPAKV